MQKSHGDYNFRGVRTLFARVESNAHADAVLAKARTVRSTCVPPVFINGDKVVVRWIFEFAFKDGRAMRIEELAYQRWAGERVAEEQFFYDPKQLARA